MTISSRCNHLIYPSNISRLQTLFLNLHRWNHTYVQNGGEDSSSRCYDYIDKSSWRTVDARFYGVKRWQVSLSSRTILDILRREGFEAYLVGGCVRDLLLHRIPKDFDVITTASLKEIKKLFNKNARVVGNRFPICHVRIKNSIVEVSSFDTHAKDANSEETQQRKPTGCTRVDFTRWQNCLRRDFTINSLFYDPFAGKIYDYINGMRDLKKCKVQTVIPAHLSFKEDCARILRGVRIAARLGLSFSGETAIAIQDLYLSIMDLSKGRLEMEMDYMFSYGAAESSLNLLQRFKILDILLPFHAAYLSEHGHDQNTQSSSMLCKLFSNVDKLFSCDRPCTSLFWVGVLAVHLALVNHPQDALVVWTFSSLLYYGNWEDALKVAREKSRLHVAFEPEIKKSCCNRSDKELAEDVRHFASHVTYCIDALTEPQCLVQAMARYPLYPCSDFVCISKAKGRAAAKVFSALLKDVKSHTKNRRSFEVNYEFLKGGYVDEARFVLGKVMMNTMSAGVVQDQELQAHLPSSKVIEGSSSTTLYPHDGGHLLGNERDLPSSKIVKEGNIMTLHQHDQRHLLGNEKERLQQLNAKRKVFEKAERVLESSHLIQKEEGNFPDINTKISKKVKVDEHQQKSESNQEHMVKAENEKDGLQNPNAKRKVVEKEERVRKSCHLVQKGDENVPVIKSTQSKKVKEDEHEQSESDKKHMVKKPGNLSLLFRW